MVKVLGQYKIRAFEYIYVFVMVVYMAQMTNATSRMIGGLSGNPIPFLIPIVLTVILLARHRVSFINKRLGIVLLLTTVWSICIIVKEHLYSSNELSYIFFLYYAILIAFIHCQVFSKRLMDIYEDVMVFFAKVSIPLWLFAVLFPGISDSFFHLFPETGYGNNVLYLFNWMDPSKGQIYYILRNAGCSWEPGRFSIMLTLAICFNLLRNGVKFRNNSGVVWLLLSLLSTQSTTGYSITIFLYVVFYIRRVAVGYIIGFIFVLTPITLGVLQLDFMTEKIQDRLSFAKDIDETLAAFEYNEQHKEEGEYLSSLDRFESIYFEYFNILEDPLLGYGRNTQHSYFYQNISSHNTLTGGLLKLFGQMGIPFGLILYYILYRSSVAIGRESNNKKRTALFFTILFSSISYITFTIPIFTSFWFYSLFKKNESHNHRKVALPPRDGVS